MRVVTFAAILVMKIRAGRVLHVDEKQVGAE